MAGLGTDGSGVFINPKMRTWRHPFHRLKFKVYVSAGGVVDETQADAQIVERLTRLVNNIEGHGKHRLLAFDKNYRRDRTADLRKTEFYVPNDHVFSIAAAHPDLFEPVISVNPYRPDALNELERGQKRGARMVKWLPNAMGIDPSDELCDPFYQQMKRLGLVLLLLFADISAMTQYNRAGALRTILAREDLHERLVNGSDYPLPAINILIRTGGLVKQGYINADERACLNEIYDYNPLLFDFVLKRTLKLPGTSKRLPASVFMANRELEA
ncbi:MAG TPA: hypothetical protein VIU65_12210 [Pyrinomonadaceae bacterium]